MIITLNRTAATEDSVFGVLRMNDTLFYTVEQDWNNNVPEISCIPNGTYDLEYYKSEKHGDTYSIVNEVLGIGRFKGTSRRFGCLFHVANLASELKGCIGVGTAQGMVNGYWAVLSSKKAMNAMVNFLGKTDKHHLIIQSHFPNFTEFHGI